MNESRIRSDVAWLARLARSSSWPLDMAQRVEDAAGRVLQWADEPAAALATRSRPPVPPGASNSEADRIGFADYDGCPAPGEPDDGGAWTVQLICCGRDDGTFEAATWEKADAFRTSYITAEGHERSAVIVRSRRPAAAAPPQPGAVWHWARPPVPPGDGEGDDSEAAFRAEHEGHGHGAVPHTDGLVCHDGPGRHHPGESAYWTAPPAAAAPPQPGCGFVPEAPGSRCPATRRACNRPNCPVFGCWLTSEASFAPAPPASPSVPVPPETGGEWNCGILQGPGACTAENPHEFGYCGPRPVPSVEERRATVEVPLPVVNALVDFFGTRPCRLDHDGYCQEHLLEHVATQGCSLAALRSLAAPPPVEPEEPTDDEPEAIPCSLCGLREAAPGMTACAGCA